MHVRVLLKNWNLALRRAEEADCGESRGSAASAGEHLVDPGHRGQRAEEDERQHRIDARADEGHSQRAHAAAASQVPPVGGGRDERPGDHLHAAQSAGDAERRAGRRGGGRTVAIAIDVGVGRVEGGEKEERKKERKETHKIRRKKERKKGLFVARFVCSNKQAKRRGGGNAYRPRWCRGFASFAWSSRPRWRCSPDAPRSGEERPCPTAPSYSGSEKRQERCTKSEKPFLGRRSWHVLNTVVHCSSKRFREDSTSSKAFYWNHKKHRETHIDKINDREKAIRFFHLLHNAVD